MKSLAVIITSLLLSACQLSIVRPDYAPVADAVSIPATSKGPGVKASEPEKFYDTAVVEAEVKAPAVPVKPAPVVAKPAPKPAPVVAKPAPKPAPVVAKPAPKPAPVVAKPAPVVVQNKPTVPEPPKPEVVKIEPKPEPPKSVVVNDATVNVYAGLPPGAVQNLPLLASTVEAKWPNVPRPSTLAGQIEQETCISLTHSKCFTSRAELKTSREWGVSFGQFTIAYDAKGRERFNAFEDVKKLDRELAAWQFSDRYNEKYGMMAFVVRMRSEFDWVKGAQDFTSQQAFALSGYNGGRGGVLQDRRLCVATKGCNPNVWYGNVEKTSYKSRVAPKGYGQSLYNINRGYVDNVQNKRSKKYIPFMMKALKCQTNC